MIIWDTVIVISVKNYHSLGIARHRAMHRDKEEDCEITFSDNETYSFKYSQKKLNVETKSEADEGSER